MRPGIAVGLNASALRVEHVVECGVQAEALGYESVWLGEHIATQAVDGWWRKFPGAASDPTFTEEMVPFTLQTPWPDPLIVLAQLSGMTSRLRLGLGVYLVALRQPLLAGKSLATLDMLSGGRLDLAVGLGWSEDDYTFSGVEWASRGRRMDEMIRALRTLFDDPRPSFDGEFFNFPEIVFEPKPRQAPFAIHVGGYGVAAMRRAAHLGNGWYGSPEAIPEIRRMRDAAGRSDPFQFSALSMAGPLAHSELERLADAGVERVVVTPWATTKSGSVGREGLGAMRRYAERIGLAD